MDETRNWIVGLIAIIAILGLLLFARGDPDGRRDGTMSVAVAIESIV